MPTVRRLLCCALVVGCGSEPGAGALGFGDDAPAAGTPESCTSDAVVAAVAKGGVITFSCGPAPKTIVLDRTAKIVNDTGPKIVIDGGGEITLSGGGEGRILYPNTRDKKQK